MNSYFTNAKWSYLISFLMISLIIGLAACDKDDNNDNEMITNEEKLSGVWEFTLMPDVSVHDTTLVKGYRESDFEEYAASYSDIILYQNESYEIEGENGLFFFDGKKTNDEIQIKVYQHPNGYADPDMAISEMLHVSTMVLKADEYGKLSGTGTFTEHNVDPNAIYESYKVKAIKVQDISNKNEFKQLKFDLHKVLCDIGSDISSFIISEVSDNVFRPISDCYLHKEGGGYYVFGHEGPGSTIPIYTQTVYFPYEWSFCGVKKYTFKMKLESEVTLIEDLLWAAENDKPSSEYFKKLGFETLQDFKNLISDFNSKYGEFGISFVYSEHSKDMGLYVNHKSDKKDEVLEHELITKMETALKSHGHRLFKKEGKEISDDWHLRRSDAGVCNTPLLICYVIGTNNVYYE